MNNIGHLVDCSWGNMAEGLDSDPYVEEHWVPQQLSVPWVVVRFVVEVCHTCHWVLVVVVRMSRRNVPERAMADTVLADNMDPDTGSTSPADVAGKGDSNWVRMLDNAFDVQVWNRGRVLVDHICMVEGDDRHLNKVKITIKMCLKLQLLSTYL